MDDVTTTIFNRQIYIYMYVFHVNYKKMKNYNATNLLQKNKYKNVQNITTTDSRISHTLRNIATTDSKISHTTCVHFTSIN